MSTDTTEKGFEDLIVSALTGLPLGAGRGANDRTAYPPAAYGGEGYLLGSSRDYDREYAVDLHHLREFLAKTQPDVLEALDLENDGPTRRNFLARLQGEITNREINVLHECRTRLISDVVTGKLDVRGYNVVKESDDTAPEGG